MDIKSYESYILVSPESWEKDSALGLKALKTADTSKVIKPVKIIMNGEEQTIFPFNDLVYTANSKEMQSENNKKQILSALGEALRIVDGSEFLEKCFIVLQKNYIFYSSDECCVKFIIAPFSVRDAKDAADKNAAWMRECIAFIEELTGDRGNITPENIFSYLNSDKPVYTYENVQEESIGGKELILRYTGPYGHFSLYVTGSEFRIGKDNSMEGNIPFNPSISREHCIIFDSSDGYYIQDSNSTNGTFINGERVFADVARRIGNGDVIRLSDMDFIVEIR